MKTVNMHEAKTHLSRLVAEAVKGEPFVIARAGKPLVKVEPVEEVKPKTRRLGFGIGRMSPIPDEFFDPSLDKEIEEMFYGVGDGQKFAGLDFPYPEPGDPDQRIQLTADEYREKYREQLNAEIDRK